MNKVTKFIIFNTICLFSFLISCQHETLIIKPVPNKQSTKVDGINTTVASSTTTTNTTTSSEVVCFSRDVLPIFASNCSVAGCHDALTKEAGYNLTSYSSIVARGLLAGNAANSKIYKEITKGGMPPYPNKKLTPAQLQTIEEWINKGAKNGDCQTSTCDTLLVTFSKQINTIILNSCVGCHNGPFASKNRLITSFADVSEIARSGLLMDVLNGLNGKTKMPPNTPLDDCQKSQILKWIKLGIQNN